MMQAKMKNKVLVIALDGGTFEVLRPLIEKNKLPTIKSILENGVNGQLRSILPPITPVAWSSFMTGKNPAKHRIFSFFVKDDHTGLEVPVDANLRKGKTLWDIIGENGGKIIVLNVPVTYPPQKVNGVLVSGFLTPEGKKDFIYPQFLVREIEERFGEYPLFTKTPPYSANLSLTNFNKFIRELFEILAYKFKVAHYLLDNYDFDFFMIHIWGTDKIQHELWNLIDEKHRQFNKNMSKKCIERIFNYFEVLDFEISRLVERVHEGVSLFIVSDHGFGPIHKLINLNTWLLKEGYIKIKKRFFSLLRYILWKLGLTPEFIYKNIFRRLLRLKWAYTPKSPYDAIKYQVENKNKFFLSLDDIDWPKSKAYSKAGSFGTIFINRACREITSSIDPEKEYQKIRKEIASKLKNLTDVKDNSKIESNLYFKEDIYRGRYLDSAPDIVFYAQESGYLSGAILGFGSNKAILDNIISSGHHRMDGIFIAKGKDIISGKEIRDAHLIDITPTILYLMDLGIPRDMDGKVLESIFTNSFLKKQKPRYIDDPLPEEDKYGSLNEGDKADIVKKLKNLRYIT